MMEVCVKELFIYDKVGKKKGGFFGKGVSVWFNRLFFVFFFIVVC